MGLLLTLQELASKLSAQPADQLSLLHQAAEVYMEACRLKGGRHAPALCEWAVAGGPGRPRRGDPPMTSESRQGLLSSLLGRSDSSGK
jgi:hypothetical protein